jgi:hypothetical protein
VEDSTVMAVTVSDILFAAAFQPVFASASRVREYCVHPCTHIPSGLALRISHLALQK